MNHESQAKGSSGKLDAENIRDMQQIYAAANLEELRLFQVADKLATERWSVRTPTAGQD
jgi:hypothetical protein